MNKLVEELDRKMAVTTTGGFIPERIIVAPKHYQQPTEVVIMEKDPKKAKAKMSGTRAKRQGISMMAMASALFGLMGGYAMGIQGDGFRSCLGKEKANRSKELVEVLMNKAAEKRERKSRSRYCHLSAMKWVPKSSSKERLEWKRDRKGHVIPPMWASQKKYAGEFKALVLRLVAA